MTSLTSILTIQFFLAFRKKKEINVLQDEKLKIMNEFTEFSQESVTQHHEILKDKVGSFDEL